LIVLASYTMIVLNIPIVITALPKIHQTLGLSPVALSWVQNAYLLAFGGLLLLLRLGAGQGGALGPLTAAGIASVAAEDAGAAGGITSVFHQIGGSLGLVVLVAVFAAASSTTLHGPELLAHRISAALTVGAAMLASRCLSRSRSSTTAIRTSHRTASTRPAVSGAAQAISAAPDPPGRPVWLAPLTLGWSARQEDRFSPATRTDGRERRGESADPLSCGEAAFG
jgi:hypothetical protein